jgi:thioredoxin reductase (NADPH)
MVDQPIGAGEPESADRDGAFPRLEESQQAKLRALGTIRKVEPGEVLFAAGDASTDFFVVESGAVAIVQGYGAENRIVAIHGPRRFLGELGLLTGQRLYLWGVVRDAGELIQVSVHKLREIVAQDKALSDVILGAFIARRSILIEAGTGIKLIGSRFSPDSRRLREFLARSRMPYQWIDLEEDEEADALLTGLAVEPGQTPVVIDGGGQILHNPSNSELGRALGLGWSAPARPGWRPPSTRRPRDSTCRRWRPSPPGARPGHRRGSRTTSASRPASRAASWPSGPGSRRPSSGRG